MKKPAFSCLTPILAVLLATSGVFVSADDGELEKSKAASICPSAPQSLQLNKTGEVIFINCQNNGWQTLDVTVTGFNGSKLAFEINSLINFNADDSFLVITKINDKDVEIHNDATLQNGHKDVWMPTGLQSLQIKIQKKTAKSNGVVAIRIHTECSGTFGKPKFDLPLIPNKGKDANLPTTTCSFNVTQPSMYEFLNVTLAKGSQLVFSRGVNKPFDGPYDKLPPHVVIGSVNTNLLVTLNLLDPNQTLSLSVSQLTDKVCGATPMVSLQQSTDITAGGDASRSGQAHCAWLVDAGEGKKVKLSVDKVNFNYANDLLSIIDSGVSKRPLVQVTTLTANTQPIVSSGRYLLIFLISSNFNDNAEALTMKASPIAFGGSLFGQGNMTLSDSSDYYLTTNSNESIYVIFGSVGSLEGEQKITIFTDFVSTIPLISFEKSQGPFDISSPASQLRVQATGFVKPENVTFRSVPRDSGCMRTFVGAQENNMRLIGGCKGQSTWLIRPEVEASDDMAIFIKVWPNNVKSATIKQLTKENGKITVNDTSDPFMFAYLAKAGARVDLASQSQNFEMSYTTGSIKTPIEVAPSEGSNFTLMSPFFPGLYPRALPFLYNIKPDKPSDFYLASFHAMDLSQGDTLYFGMGDLQFIGSDLPADVLVNQKQFKNVTFVTSDNPPLNPRGTYGFRINFAPVGSSGTITKDENKTYAFDGKACSALRCVYIIDLPLPEDKDTGLSVNLTVTLPPNKTLADGDLLVWDGESTLRSPLLAPTANFTHGGLFASRSKRVIIRYQGSEQVTFSFVTNECEFKPPPAGATNGTYTMCRRDRTCMPASWRCDRKSQCSDGSDEYYCDKYTPSPDPQPTPRSGSNGWKTAFLLCMPIFVLLGVLLTKGVPVARQRFRESRYQQFHDLGDH